MAKRRTHDDFVNEVKDLVGDEYTVLGEFKRMKTHITMKHEVCGNIYEVTPDHFLRGNRCPKCARAKVARKRTKTHEEFVREFNEKSNGEYELLSRYHKLKGYIKVRHKICGYEYEVRADNFLRGKRCPKCAEKIRGKKRRLTNEEFVRRLNDAFGGKIIALDEYQTERTTIRFKCLECYTEFKTSPSSLFISTYGCPTCVKKYKDFGNKTQEQFLEEVRELVGDEYEVLSKYINIDTPVTFRHIKCGEILTTTPYRFLKRGTRCKSCTIAEIAEKFRKTNEEYSKELHEKFGDEFELVGDYKGAHSIVHIRHNKCGRVFKTLANSFLRGGNCVKCKASKGEIEVRRVLEQLGVNFIEQYTFDDLRIVNPLRFDFAVKDNSGNLLFLIEYDGELHYIAARFYGGKKKLLKQQYRDKLKDEYCKERGIDLLRIPYWKFDNIREIIENKLNEYTSTTRECS